MAQIRAFCRREIAAARPHVNCVRGHPAALTDRTDVLIYDRAGPLWPAAGFPTHDCAPVIRFSAPWLLWRNNELDLGFLGADADAARRVHVHGLHFRSHSKAVLTQEVADLRGEVETLVIIHHR